jgi:hypothetical protein
MATNQKQAFSFIDPFGDLFFCGRFSGFKKYILWVWVLEEFTRLAQVFYFFFKINFQKTQLRFQNFGKFIFTRVSKCRFSHISNSLIFKGNFHISVFKTYFILGL